MPTDTSPPEEEEENDTTETTDSVPSNGSKSKAPESEEEEADEASDSSVKVPETFQEEVSELLNGCTTMSCLDFLQAEVSAQRTKLMSSQKKAGLNKADFSSEEMPSSD